MLGVRVLRRTVILRVLCTEKGGEDELRGGSWFVHQAVPAAAVGAEHSLHWGLALVCLLTAPGGQHRILGEETAAQVSVGSRAETAAAQGSVGSLSNPKLNISTFT